MSRQYGPIIDLSGFLHYSQIPCYHTPPRPPLPEIAPCPSCMPQHYGSRYPGQSDVHHHHHHYYFPPAFQQVHRASDRHSRSHSRPHHRRGHNDRFAPTFFWGTNIPACDGCGVCGYFSEILAPEERSRASSRPSSWSSSTSTPSYTELMRERERLTGPVPAQPCGFYIPNDYKPMHSFDLPSPSSRLMRSPGGTYRPAGPSPWSSSNNGSSSYEAGAGTHSSSSSALPPHRPFFTQPTPPGTPPPLMSAASSPKRVSFSDDFTNLSRPNSWSESSRPSSPYSALPYRNEDWQTRPPRWPSSSMPSSHPIGFAVPPRPLSSAAAAPSSSLRDQYAEGAGLYKMSAPGWWNTPAQLHSRSHSGPSYSSSFGSGSHYPPPTGTSSSSSAPSSTYYDRPASSSMGSIPKSEPFSCHYRSPEISRPSWDTPSGGAGSGGHTSYGTSSSSPWEQNVLRSHSAPPPSSDEWARGRAPGYGGGGNAGAGGSRSFYASDCSGQWSPVRREWSQPAPPIQSCLRTSSSGTGSGMRSASAPATSRVRFAPEADILEFEQSRSSRSVGRVAETWYGRKSD